MIVHYGAPPQDGQDPERSQRMRDFLGGVELWPESIAKELRLLREMFAALQAQKDLESEILEVVRKVTRTLAESHPRAVETIRDILTKEYP